MDRPSENDCRRIIGVDPGLNITGYGVIECRDRSIRVIEAGVLRTRARGDLPARLVELKNGLDEILEQFAPDDFAIEELYSHYDRPRTAILMGHARGVLCLGAAVRNIPIRHYAATQIKRVLTGSGRAPKDQVQLSVCRELSLSSPPEPPDVADALAIALCHRFLSRSESIIS